jgi:hypothetical protein
MVANTSLDLFASNTTRPGELGCRAEIAATLAAAMAQAAERGVSREEIAARMAGYLGEKISVATLNGYAAPSHTHQAAEHGEPARDISLMRALAFDAAVEQDVLLGLFARKRGARQVVSRDEVEMLEWAKLHQEEKLIGERRKALEVVIKMRGVGK